MRQLQSNCQTGHPARVKPTCIHMYPTNSQPMHMRSRRELWKGKQQTRLHWLTALRTQQSSLVLTVPHPTSLLPQRAT